MPLTEDFVRRDIAWLAGIHERRLTKFRRNFNRYANNGRRSEDIREQYGNPLSFYNLSEGEDTGTTPNLNIIKSAIDTHVSKVSQIKVRPFFNPLVGTFKTRKVCRNAQAYFDEFYEMQDVYRKSIQCIKDADIFEVGCLWVDDESQTVKRIAPWEWKFDPAEYNFGKLMRGYVIFKQYPLAFIKEKVKKGAPDLYKQLEENPALKGEYAIYYSMEFGKKYHIVNNIFLETLDIEFKCPPVAMLYLEDPIKGAFSLSMADELYTIQAQIDSLCERIHLAIELSPANTIWVPKNSEVKTSMLSNEIGKVYGYQPPPAGGGVPVVVSTPPAIDPQYLSMLEFWIRQGYEMKGISQLSAQAKKPSGLNSGVALQTVEDVESERHNPMEQSYIRFLMDVAKTCIEVFPKNQEILPKKSGRANISWKDIKQERDAFSIQFSASSSLSKDPKVKMEQVEKLIAMKILNPALAASILEFPDLEAAYSITTSSYDYCQRVIERAVEDDDYDFYEVVNIEQLFGEAVNTLLRLDANEEKKATLDRLVKLIVAIKTKMDTINELTSPPPGPQEPQGMNPPTAPGPTNPLPVAPGPPTGPAMAPVGSI